MIVHRRIATEGPRHANRKRESASTSPAPRRRYVVGVLSRPDRPRPEGSPCRSCAPLPTGPLRPPRRSCTALPRRARRQESGGRSTGWHGLLVAERVGDRIVYSLNRDHVLHPAVAALIRSADELSRRLRKEISGWQVQPVAAALYGSAARRDGDANSDVDVLLIRPAGSGPRQDDVWSGQVHRLRDQVYRWTGNRCQVTDRPVSSLRKLSRSREVIVDEWRKDAIKLAGTAISQLLDGI